MKTPLWLLSLMLFALTARACIWDAETLFQEKLRNHDLAKAILGELPAPENPQPLQERIKNLKANRDENNPDWWNNLAGAYLRLNQPATAVKLLEPVVAKFPNDYGIHANLGTAYHLLGRYQDAEKEIARDLEINPDAHFGLEKYHLALLQYLIRDSKYQSRHVYVDEFTPSIFEDFGGRFYFIKKEQAQSLNDDAQTNNLVGLENDFRELSASTNNEDVRLAFRLLQQIAAIDSPPSYQARWNLAQDTNFEAGVIYMAEMNPNAPACSTMLGIAAWKKRDYHLAVTAFEKAIAIGSPQSDLLKLKIDALNDYIRKSGENSMLNPHSPSFPLLCLIPLVIACYTYSKIRDRQRKLKIKT